MIGLKLVLRGQLEDIQKGERMGILQIKLQYTHVLGPSKIGDRVPVSNLWNSLKMIAHSLITSKTPSTSRIYPR
jgi:hypothetical protein